MNSARVHVLAAQQITTPMTLQSFTPIRDLRGMSGVSIEAQLAYGTGGASLIAWVQTSLGGTIWHDIARFDFATTGAIKIANLSALTPKGIVSASSLAAEGVLDGFLGDALRLVCTSTGNYANSVLTVRAAVR